MLLFYSNSLLASLLSLLSCLGIIYAVLDKFHLLDRFGIGGYLPDAFFVPALLVCVVGLILARLISDGKSFRKWKKGLEEKGWPEKIRNSKSDAIFIYNYKPERRTLRYIEKLNPEAAAAIRRGETGRK